MTIEFKIRTYTATLKQIKELNLEMDTYPNSLLEECTGYACLIVDNNLYYDLDYVIDENAEFKVLTNNYEIPNMKTDKTKTLKLKFDDSEQKNAKIPTFGITIDNNINCVQLNYPIENARRELEKHILWYVDINGELKSNFDSITKEKLIRDGNFILKNGYDKAVSIYIDDKIQVVHNPHIYVLMCMLNMNTVPLRIFCYKDIKYLQKLCPEFYTAIMQVPLNNFYSPTNQLDMTNHFLANYSDKRAAFKKYSKLISFLPPNKKAGEYNVHSERVDFNDWYPIYYYAFDKTFETLNHQLADKILAEDVYATFENYTALNDSFRRTAATYMKGYMDVIECTDEDYVDNFDFNDYEHQEVYRVSNKIDGGILPLMDLNYYNEKDEKINEKELLEHYNADILIYFDDYSKVIGAKNLHNLLNNETVTVKYVRKKK